MRRIGIVIILALVLTVGSVYATFSYAQGEVAQKTSSISTNVADKVVTTEKGTITIDNSFAISVDDTSGALKTSYTTSGTTKVTFTAATGADDDVKNNGIKLKLTITFGGTNKYNGTDIFTTKAAYTAGGVVLNGGNKVLGEITINLADYLAVSEISLPTAAEYDLYKSAFDATTITITVSETA